MREQVNESGENVSEIQRLTTRAHDLSVSIAHWNDAYMVLVALTVLLAVGVFVTQFVASKKGRLLAATQDALITEKDRLAGADSRNKEGRIADALQTAGDSNKAAGEANERASKAELAASKAQENLAGAEARAAEANAKAESFRLDIAKANQQAASANEIAERERFARLQLEARLADRVLSPSQQEAIASAVRPFGSFSLQVFWYSDTTEVTRLSGAISSSLTSAGWTVAGAHAQGGVTVTGIVLAIHRNASEEERRAAMEVALALRANGIAMNLTDTPMEDIPSPGMTFGSTTPNPQMRMMIGDKPK